MSNAQSSQPTRAATPISALFGTGTAGFWRLWTVGLVVFVVRWLETVAVGVVVYQRTDSAFLVAAMTMFRVLPMGLLGAFLGAWAERIERRISLIAVVILMGTVSLILALLAYTDRLEVWHLALASLLNGLGWATDNPVRRVMIGDVVGSERMGTAMSLDVGASNASRMVGPTIAGLILAGFGIDGVFALSVALYMVALVAAVRVRYRNSEARNTTSVLARISEGLRLVRGDPRLMGTLLVTVIFNVFAWPFTSMIPVIGRDQLLLGPQGVGILASMDGIGSFLGALVLALWLKPSWYGRAYVGGVLLYMVMLIVFALVSDPLVAGLSLVVTGFGQAGFATMQATLTYLLAPPEMRSRILGVLSVCIGTGPIGFLWIGLVADVVGAHWATAGTGVVGLLCMAATWRLWRTI